MIIRMWCDVRAGQDLRSAGTSLVERRISGDRELGVLERKDVV